MNTALTEKKVEDWDLKRSRQGFRFLILTKTSRTSLPDRTRRQFMKCGIVESGN
jgi:hypothetical protein